MPWGSDKVKFTMQSLLVWWGRKKYEWVTIVLPKLYSITFTTQSSIFWMACLYSQSKVRHAKQLESQKTAKRIQLCTLQCPIIMTIQLLIWYSCKVETATEWWYKTNSPHFTLNAAILIRQKVSHFFHCPGDLAILILVTLICLHGSRYKNEEKISYL